MKIAIAGAGMTGAYLYRLLRSRGHEIDIFDRDPGTRCEITPCAWITSRSFAELVQAAGLDPRKYFLQHLDYIVIDEMRIKAHVFTFNKPGLIKDLLQGAEIKYSALDVTNYERTIDATGVSRAFAGDSGGYRFALRAVAYTDRDAAGKPRQARKDRLCLVLPPRAG